ncbi:MAG TPA: DUF2207 domain-containing protein [Actinomycetota bacterium]|nr:DUF2207 domain-containing protein [Actinomycetota bacterium]
MRGRRRRTVAAGWLASVGIASALAVGAAPTTVEAQKSLVFEEFASEIQVRPDADIIVTETLRPRFEGSWNGIERVLELRPPADYGVAYLLEVRLIGATDGAGHPLRTEETRLDRDTRRFRVWVPEATDRTATVILRYQVGNALGFFAPDTTGLTLDELYWQVTGTTSDVPILSARARVVLPAGAQPKQAAAYVGGAGSTRQTRVILGEGSASVPAVGPLDPGEGLTVAVGWAAGAVTRPAGAAAPTTAAQSGGRGRVGAGGTAPGGPWSPLALWPVLLPLLAFWLAYRAWRRRGRDPAERAITVRWEPPPDISPAEAGTLVDHRADMPDIVATLVDLAVRGVVVIEEREKGGFLSFGKDYAFHLMKPSPQWDDLADHEREFLNGLFERTTRRERVKAVGEKTGGFLKGVVETFTGEPAEEGAPDGAIDSVLLSDLKNEFYRTLPDIRDAIYRQLVLKGHYLRRPDTVRRRWVLLSMLCVGIGSIGFAGAAGGAGNGRVMALALIVGGFASALIVGVFGWLMPARTEQGARTREAALGFKRFLERVETPRYRRMITSPKQFEEYLPFAMAFGCEEQWAKAFEGLLTEPPEWYLGTHGAFRASAFASDLGTLSTAAASTLSSSPSSSGSGGGGSVGGGGGGGGVGGF